jgi:Flp pilus assembly protein TadG
MSVLERFAACTKGGIAAMTAILFPVFLGTSGLALELGYWYTVKRAMQLAADASAMTAATANAAGDTGYANEAFAVAAQNGWSGTNLTNDLCTATSTVKVCVNSPPKYGNYTSTSSAIEVVISRSQSAFLAWAVGYGGPTSIMAHAVVSPGKTGTACILALGSGSSSIQVNGGGSSGAVTLNNCDADSHGGIAMNGSGSAMTTRTFDIAGSVTGQGTVTVTGPAGTSNSSDVPNDPYAGFRSIGTKPSTCTPDPHPSSGTISPGAYCGLTIGGNVTMQSGIYYIEGGQFSMSTGTLTSAAGGVTIVLTSASTAPTTFATVNISGQATLDLTALATGPTAGIVFYGDPAQPVSQGATEIFSGQSNNSITGAFYFPTQTTQLSGKGSWQPPTPGGCFEIVAQTIKFNGNADMSDGCVGTGVLSIGGSPTKLVE